ncbi:MAG: hypothetical protein J0I23_30765 [Rhizobiales bacterium]|nr:hypothetical protein [Hyphomicrobiales bacterium]
MAKKKTLTDEDVYDRLHDAYLALGKEPGATVPGNTTIVTARIALQSLQKGLLMAIESGSQVNSSILDPSKQREP